MPFRPPHKKPQNGCNMRSNIEAGRYFELNLNYYKSELLDAQRTNIQLLILDLENNLKLFLHDNYFPKNCIPDHKKSEILFLARRQKEALLQEHPCITY